MTLILDYISTLPATIKNISRTSLPYIPDESMQSFISNLGHLSKMYNNKIKYRGTNNSFALKLNIFYDCCQQVFLSYTIKVYILVLLTMLKGKV